MKGAALVELHPRPPAPGRRIIADEVRRQTQAGEGIMTAAAREVAQALRTEPDQVDGDLVVSGRYGRNPATVRFPPLPRNPRW